MRRCLLLGTAANLTGRQSAQRTYARVAFTGAGLCLLGRRRTGPPGNRQGGLRRERARWRSAQPPTRRR